MSFSQPRIITEEENEQLKNQLGDLYVLPDVVIGNIIEFLQTKEVKDLKFVSRPLKVLASNDDFETQNLNRPRHANLNALTYKMLNKETIIEIIKDAPVPFPPNSYYFEELIYNSDYKLKNVRQSIINYNKNLYLYDFYTNSYFFSFYVLYEGPYKKKYFVNDKKTEYVNESGITRMSDRNELSTNIFKFKDILENNYNEDFIFYTRTKNFGFKDMNGSYDYDIYMKYGLKKIT
jgi:hypothetical protein